MVLAGQALRLLCFMLVPRLVMLLNGAVADHATSWRVYSSPFDTVWVWTRFPRWARWMVGLLAAGHSVALERVRPSVSGAVAPLTMLRVWYLACRWGLEMDAGELTGHGGWQE